MNDEINFNDWTYFCSGPNIAPYFVSNKGFIKYFNEIKNGNISRKTGEVYQKKFESTLREITLWNLKHKKIWIRCNRNY